METIPDVADCSPEAVVLIAAAADEVVLLADWDFVSIVEGDGKEVTSLCAIGLGTVVDVSVVPDPDLVLVDVSKVVEAFAIEVDSAVETEALEPVCIALVVLAAISGAAPVVEDTLVAAGGSTTLVVLADVVSCAMVACDVVVCRMGVVLCALERAAAESKEEASANKLPVNVVAVLGTAVHRPNPLIAVSENPAGRFGLFDILSRNGNDRAVSTFKG